MLFSTAIIASIFASMSAMALPVSNDHDVQLHDPEPINYNDRVADDQVYSELTTRDDISDADIRNAQQKLDAQYQKCSDIQNKKDNITGTDDDDKEKKSKLADDLAACKKTAATQRTKLEQLKSDQKKQKADKDDDKDDD